MKAVLVAPGMLKKLMSSKSPTSVRSACCSLIALLCKRSALRSLKACPDLRPAAVL